MANDERKSLGSRCEALAAAYLEQKGFCVRERNYRTRLGEVDLLCEDGDTLVFVEVKARRSAVYGTGSEAVGFRKQRRLMAIAALYLANEPEKACRFDVVSMIVQGERVVEIDHLPNAFP